MQNSVVDSWDRIEKWLTVNTPPGVEFLASGATEEQIEEAEKVLSVRLPNDLRQSYLRYNGAPLYNSPKVFEYGEFCSLERMIHYWNIWHELYKENGEFHTYESDPDPGIKNSWWNSQWIPFCDDRCGNALCVDLDPAEGGIRGQVIEMVHDDSGRSVWAPSFAAWLSAYADSLEAGEYGVDPDSGVVPIGWLED